jgi:hypothetical protein
VNFKRRGYINWNKFNTTLYFDYADKLLEYGKKYLTGAAIASYLLKTLEIEEPKHVLLFGRGPFDYLEVTLLSGFSDLGIKTSVATWLGENIFKMKTNNEPITRKERDEYLEKLTKKSRQPNAHGAGFGFLMRLGESIQRPFHNTDPDPATIRRELLIEKKYDLILYVTRPPYKYINEAQKSGAKIAFLQYKDMYDEEFAGSTREACRYGPVFIREMDDFPC